MSNTRLSLAHGANAHRDRARMIQLATTGQEWSNANGTLRGWKGGAVATGQLPDVFVAEARAAQYVIYSYSTPIAWQSQDGRWHQPLTRYSNTTSRHQSLAARITR